MSGILDELASEAVRRTERARMATPLEVVRREAVPMSGFPFESALRKPGMSFICELKRASPSKGTICEGYPYLEIAKEYEDAGASCISVLTEPSRFLGDISHLTEVSKRVNVPLLRKDFVVDEYMIYEARRAGASAVLLICSLLDERRLSEYIETCDALGMSALVEAHDRDEVRKAVDCGARIIGVNNRDLRDFSVDARNCLRLRPYVPDDVLFVAESGISSREDVECLKENGVDAVLIGETLMRSNDRKAKLRELGCGR